MNRMIPFGCAIVSFKSMPRIKYHLDFGNALGGSYSAGAIKAVIASIVDSVLLSMFVWPNRFIVSAETALERPWSYKGLKLKGPEVKRP
jgi:hypothetical protein